MTDKTIINGVDVKGCDFYSNDDACGCGLAECVAQGCRTITNFKCKYNPTCYYKQLLYKIDDLNRAINIIDDNDKKFLQISKLINKLKDNFETVQKECNSCQDEAIKNERDLELSYIN